MLHVFSKLHALKLLSVAYRHFMDELVYGWNMCWLHSTFIAVQRKVLPPWTGRCKQASQSCFGAKRGVGRTNTFSVFFRWRLWRRWQWSSKQGWVILSICSVDYWFCSDNNLSYSRLVGAWIAYFFSGTGGGDTPLYGVYRYVQDFPKGMVFSQK